MHANVSTALVNLVEHNTSLGRDAINFGPFIYMPSEVRKLLTIDKSQVPNIRIVAAKDWIQ